MSKKSYGNKLVLVIFAFLLAGMYIVLFKQLATLKYVNPSSSAIERTNTYTSNILEMSVTVSDGFEVEERHPVVYLQSYRGEITITQNNLDVDDFDYYIKQYDERRDVNILSSKQLQIGDYEAYERVMEFNGVDMTQKSYFIYPDQWVIYTISTTSPALYDDLEAIIQSFEYLGE